MENEPVYEVNISWDETRKGTLTSTVLNDSITVATPPEFPKGIAGVWSPEHLFIASVNSCLMTTFLAIAEYSKLDFTDYEAKAVGKLEKIEGKFMVSEIKLTPVISIRNEKDRDKAIRILNKSESACLISNSIKTKINLEPRILLAEMA